MYGFNFGVTKAIRFSANALGVSLVMAKKALLALPVPAPIKEKVAHRVEDAIATVALGVGIIIARTGLR